MKVTRLPVFGLILLAAGIVEAGDPPVLRSVLPEGTVEVLFPASEFRVGDTGSFTVMVKPAEGGQAPQKVRARFGMPYMHHWVTDEQSQPYSADGMEFESNIAMAGVFRFRIWLDYADGHEARTAIDFKVMADQPLDPKVVGE